MLVLHLSDLSLGLLYRLKLTKLLLNISEHFPLMIVVLAFSCACILLGKLFGKQSLCHGLLSTCICDHLLLNLYLSLGITELLLGIVDFPLFDVYFVLKMANLVLKLINLRLVLFKIWH